MAEAKKRLSDKDKQIEKLQQRITLLEQKHLQLKEQHKIELAKYRNGYMAEIDKAIKRAEIAERKNIAHEATIEKQKQRIDTLDRKANPHRYCLSSGATLTGIRMSPRHSNIPSLRIQTKVENETVEDAKYFEWYNPVVQKYLNGELTEYELVNEIFEPFELNCLVLYLRCYLVALPKLMLEQVAVAHRLICPGERGSVIAIWGHPNENGNNWFQTNKKTIFFTRELQVFGYFFVNLQTLL